MRRRWEGAPPASVSEKEASVESADMLTVGRATGAAAAKPRWTASDGETTSAGLEVSRANMGI